MNTTEWTTENCRIEIGITEKYVYNTSNGCYFSVPKEWTDEQIWLCLEIAVTAHKEGFARGKAAKTQEIKAVLGLDPR